VYINQLGLKIISSIISGASFWQWRHFIVPFDFTFCEVTAPVIQDQVDWLRWTTDRIACVILTFRSRRLNLKDPKGVRDWSNCCTRGDVLTVGDSDELAASVLGVPQVRQGHHHGYWTDRHRRLCVLHGLDARSSHDEHVCDRQHSAADDWKYVRNRLFSTPQTGTGTDHKKLRCSVKKCNTDGLTKNRYRW